MSKRIDGIIIPGLSEVYFSLPLKLIGNHSNNEAIYTLECCMCLGSWWVWRSGCQRYALGCKICKREQSSISWDLFGHADIRH